MTDENPQFISIHTLTNRFEGDMLLNALQQEEIPVMLRSFEETPYDGLFVSQRGWGWVMVPEEYAPRAREIIKPLLEGSPTKRLYAEPSEVDPLLWERLRNADPAAISRSAQVRFDAQAGGAGAYIVPFLNAELLCFPDRESIELLNPSPDRDYYKLDFGLYLATLHYLLEAQAGAGGLVGRWISEKDIPGGQLFFRGHHAFQTEPLLELLGARLDVFRAAAQRLGGTPVNMGDAAFRLWAFPLVPVLFVLWEGDDEFQPDIHIRFDAGINLHLRTLDVIWALVNVTCRCLQVAGKSLL